jgi:1-acyl-sn-glycerol-3-phosphate acyltransferase
MRRRVVFVMTNNFYRRRWGRWFFRLVGAIPVGTGRLAREGLERAVVLLRGGGAIGIFPEGRLSRNGELGPPQRGVAVLARMGGAQVLPLGIYGNRRAWPRGAKWLRRADVCVAFGSPIAPPPSQPPVGRAEEQAYAERIMEAVAAARERARVER